MEEGGRKEKEKSMWRVNKHVKIPPVQMQWSVVVMASACS